MYVIFFFVQICYKTAIYFPRFIGDVYSVYLLLFSHRIFINYLILYYIRTHPTNKYSYVKVKWIEKWRLFNFYTYWNECFESDFYNYFLLIFCCCCCNEIILIRDISAKFIPIFFYIKMLDKENGLWLFTVLLVTSSAIWHTAFCEGECFFFTSFR